MTKPHLRIIPEAPEAIDVNALLRADIQRRNWSAVHIAGDRREPINLGERVRRIWRA